jgi:hypothetical protein
MLEMMMSYTKKMGLSSRASYGMINTNEERTPNIRSGVAR